ncbi:hypothetical protein F8C76_01985 [Flagellimonas olearia]|uniref:ATP-binding protein n=1 Tax=Flagellimonas olearia TaxID=552546 RepID=A0A6I1E311_9FLAO|nr:hypothetical protein [Allomuricauda olearia]KAB7530300.1 hypothetical protein F8C76_01985 [Allomuricauda olearia]
MEYSINTSTNIIRDSDSKFDYVVTPNAEKTFDSIIDNAKRGQKAFNLVGSFGTGKSSFLLALEKSISGNKKYFGSSFNGTSRVIKLIGEYRSLIDALNDEFSVSHDFVGNQKLFDAIYGEYDKVKKKNGALFIILDEFGKYLEYAVQNNTSQEVYFLQKLAEFVNAQDRDIVLITSIHQNILSYSNGLSKEQRDEWKKVQGRFFTLPFNEPIEQLLFLAGKVSNSGTEPKNSFLDLIKGHNLFSLTQDSLKELESSLYPLSIVSGYVLAASLQRYGQNERSLFTFLNSIFFSQFKTEGKAFELPDLYDYLYHDFYTFIIDKTNPDFNRWSAIRIALERSESIVDIDHKISEVLIKSLGLLSIFSKAGSRLDEAFFIEYLSPNFSKTTIKNTLGSLEKNKVVRFSKFDQSFKLFEGTDLDIERAILEAENRIDEIDVLKKLNSHFEFSIQIAKAETYRKGTPRLFKFQLTNTPAVNIPKDEIDGFINLIFSEKRLSGDEMANSTQKNLPILYGYFTNTSEISTTLKEIEKTEEVLRNMEDENDRVAKRELNTIIRSNKNLLHHYVMDSLYSTKVSWFDNGEAVQINSSQQFNQALSNIAHRVYPDTPTLHSELINRHKVSGSISSARKNFWNGLVTRYHEKDLGFPKDKWPAEKTIYYTLLKNTGIHREDSGQWQLGEPDKGNFDSLWRMGLRFLDSSRSTRKCITEFQDLLSTAPMKLKQGVIDFWIPTFLFIKRGDFALYNNNGFVPYVDEHILYMITRNPKEYFVKSFVLNDLRLKLFNKYRYLLKQDDLKVLDNNSFIESIRPLLVFYKNLNQYAKTTKTISGRAIRLRETIAKAIDPEETFFEKMPIALGYNLNELSTDNQLFEDYIIDFQNHIEEIKNSFPNLLLRIESFICEEIVGKKVGFEEYSEIIRKRYAQIKEHHLKAHQKSFYWRITSNFNDRDSYLMALSHSILNKPLDRMNDPDEGTLKIELKKITKELDNLVDLNKAEANEGENLIKIRLSTIDNGDSETMIRISENQKVAIENISSEIEKVFKGNEKLRLSVLASLINREISKNE